MAALYWLVAGHYYEITGADVQNACAHTLKAAENEGVVDETKERIRGLVAGEGAG